MTLGEKIKHLRKAKKMTQTDLAKRIGISKRTIQNYEAGTTDITLNALGKIAEALDVPAEELYTDMHPTESATESKPAAGHGSPAENFNEYLRQHIIGCVEGLDDRIALLDITSKVEQVLRDLAEEEMEKELYHED